MTVIKLPRFMRQTAKAPDDNWDKELEAIRGIGEWLAELDEKGQARALSYWWWRIREGKSPVIDEWVNAVAVESADDVMITKSGFG